MKGSLLLLVGAVILCALPLVARVEPVPTVVLLAPVESQPAPNSDVPVLPVWHRDGSTREPVSNVVLRGAMYKAPGVQAAIVTGQFYVDDHTDGAPFVRVQVGDVAQTFEIQRSGWHDVEVSVDVGSLANHATHEVVISMGFGAAVSSPLQRVLARNVVVLGAPGVRTSADTR